MHRLAVIIFALVLLSSCAGEKQEQGVTHDISNPTGNNTAVDEAREEWFLVAEGRYLNLYSINGEKSLKSSEQIDLSVFPVADAARLRKGIKYDTVFDAYSAMESFIN